MIVSKQQIQQFKMKVLRRSIRTLRRCDQTSLIAVTHIETLLNDVFTLMFLDGNYEPLYDLILVGHMPADRLFISYRKNCPYKHMKWSREKNI